MRPRAKDPVFGALNALEFAQIAALAGDANRAIPVLDDLLRNPSPLTVAWLKVDPTFDRIRGDPRFGALVARP